jgi:hypothetical protein
MELGYFLGGFAECGGRGEGLSHASALDLAEQAELGMARTIRVGTSTSSHEYIQILRTWAIPTKTAKPPFPCRAPNFSFSAWSRRWPRVTIELSRVTLAGT